jgi:hypothetical protein
MSNKTKLELAADLLSKAIEVKAIPLSTKSTEAFAADVATAYNVILQGIRRAENSSPKD